MSNKPIEVGDKVRKRLTITAPSGGSGKEVAEARWGRVVWIHPKRRFYLAEFHLPGGRVLRETFREGE